LIEKSDQEECKVDVLKWNIYLRVGNISALRRNWKLHNAEDPALKGCQQLFCYLAIMGA